MMNRAAEALLGVRLQEATGRLPGDLSGNTELAHQIDQVLSGCRDCAAIQWQGTDRKGAPLYLEARSVPVMGGQGGVITILRDISHERHIDNVKNEFIATAAHELRTPLTSVIGFAELLLNREYAASDPSDVRLEWVEIILEKSIALNKIVEDLLDISRMQLGQMFALDCSPGDLCSLLRKVVNDYRLIAREHFFFLDLPDGEVFASFDGDKVVQVLNNLIGNAVKFSPGGGEIHISGSIREKAFVVAIRDRGIGMTPEQLTRIFDKFYRADASNTAVEGLGLGMTIVKTIVEAHGGEIRVDSQPGAGTVAFFSIPLSLRR